jgi:chemotaxis protein methyltransferase CheR
MLAPENSPIIKDEDIALLLDDILRIYGYDFKLYAKASLKRRIHRLFILDRFPSFAEFRFKICSDEQYLRRFIEEITVNVTEMFRDPTFFMTLRQHVIPVLATYPFIRIWHAGCSTGEEAYSVAILLKEANLLKKSIQYATDINPQVVQRAASGMFPLGRMKLYSEYYIQSGGTNDFSSYYTASYDRAIFNKELSNHMVFATHNLVSESTFNQFQLIICRNVLIYFERSLQASVFKLFDDSLEHLGYLALGTKETLKSTELNTRYRQVEKEKIWRKMA